MIIRALTVDEVEEIGGAYEIHQYEGVQGQYQTYGIYGFRTPPTSPVFTPTNPYSNPSFPGSVGVFGSFDVLNWTAPVNGGFASQDAQLQTYADWANAGYPDIQGSMDSSFYSTRPWDLLEHDASTSLEHISDIGQSKKLLVDQSTGDMYKIEGDGHLVRVADGYSGAGVGVNNPMYANELNIGPLPVGIYSIGSAYNDNARAKAAGLASGKGDIVYDLTPIQGTDFPGRTCGFMIHADSASHPGAASNGCLILDRTTRSQINPGSTLYVVTHVPYSGYYPAN